MENSEQIKEDSVAAAREARRKRILENGNNRLGKITGRVHNEEILKVDTIDTNGLYPDPELERDVFEREIPLQALNPNSNQEVFELLKTLQHENKSNVESSQPIPQQTPLSKFIRSKYPVIIIALIVYSFFALNMERFIASSVFLLLMIWEIVEFVLSTFIINEPVQQNQLIAIFSMFLGLNSHSLHYVLKILGLVYKMIRDLAVFLFTFVLVHLCYSYLIIGESMSQILDKDFDQLLTKDEL